MLTLRTSGYRRFRRVSGQVGLPKFTNTYHLNRKQNGNIFQDKNPTNQQAIYFLFCTSKGNGVSRKSLLTCTQLPNDRPIMERREPVNGVTREHPLVAFSVYTDIQVKVVRRLGDDILHILDTVVCKGSVDATGLTRSYGLFWLWVLAAFEIIRTMAQAEGCFSKVLSTKLAAFKKHISPLRIVFAKQDYSKKH
jgi:hypothetical protein